MTLTTHSSTMKHAATESSTIENTIIKEKDLLEILLDEANKDCIELIDERGQELMFKQIAVIPIDEEIYCILKPLTSTDYNIGEAIVFKLFELEKGIHLLINETNEKTTIEIFLIYYNMLTEAIQKSDITENEKAFKLKFIKSISDEYNQKLKHFS